MVDLTSRLQQIRVMVDDEKYFAINRGRQYGKTTVLTALAEYLQEEYTVVSMDFQTMSYATFDNEASFVAAFSEELLDLVENFPEDIEKTSGVCRELNYYHLRKGCMLSFNFNKKEIGVKDISLGDKMLVEAVV